MKKIRFIANPFSGNAQVKSLPDKIKKHLDLTKYEYELKYTEYAGHATELAKEAAENGYFMVIAGGGDGSINEVGKALIGSETVLGVLPYGSGNGFAMHLGVGRNVDKAFEFLNNGKVLEIDTCQVNEHPYVNLSGIGFDANVAQRIKGSSLRGFKGYFKYSIEEAWSYEMQDYEIEIDGKKLDRKCFAVEVANAPMYGYGFIIAPLAKLNDGLLEVMVLKAAPKWRYIVEGWRFFNSSLDKSNLAERFQAKEVKIHFKGEKSAVHFDGESIVVNRSPISFKIVPKSLNVMVPKEY